MFRMGPDAPDVVNVAQVMGWGFVAFWECSVLPGRHVNVGVSRGKLLAHRYTLDLKVGFAIELEIIASEAEVEQLENVLIRSGLVGVFFKCCLHCP